MADSLTVVPTGDIDAIRAEAREVAKQRFKERLERGDPVTGCDCSSEETAARDGAPQLKVAGVRFVDSGQLYFFNPGTLDLEPGEWVVAETTRGQEAGRVVIAPKQVVQSSITGELKPLVRKLAETDVERMKGFKRDASKAVRVFGEKIRARNLPMKPISAEFSFDGSSLTLNFTAPERVDFRDLARELGGHFGCRVELRQVGPRDEARLLGGVGRCGRTLCCASWLPIYPDVSMNMAKTQDLPLNPAKVSGVCGRLLCCLSYENEQYRQQKQLMPRLGQTLQTPLGEGMVISMQILRGLVTVRLTGETGEQTFTAAELGLGRKEQPTPPRERAPVVAAPPVEEHTAPQDSPLDEAPRRRRRRGRGRGGNGQPAPQAGA